jgi:hypothetical protein
VEKGNIMIKYCPTTEMMDDFMSKPVQGKLFKKFCDVIFGDISSQADAWDDRSVLEDDHSPYSGEKDRPHPDGSM